MLKKLYWTTIKEYQRFKADKTESRNPKADSVLRLPIGSGDSMLGDA